MLDRRYKSCEDLTALVRLRKEVVKQLEQNKPAEDKMSGTKSESLWSMTDSQSMGLSNRAVSAKLRPVIQLPGSMSDG